MAQQNEWLFESQSPENLARVLNEHVYYEMMYAFSVPSYDMHNYSLWEMVNLARIGHARVLVAFFETSAKERKRQKYKADDVICEDYGFPSQEIAELTAEDRLRFGKDLFHLSYARLRHLKQPHQKPWPPTILNGVHKRSVEFIEYLLGVDAPSNLFINRTAWERLLGFLSSGRVFHCDASVTIPGRVSYSSYEGELLPEGYSRLTNYFIRPIDGQLEQSSNRGNSAGGVM